MRRWTALLAVVVLGAALLGNTTWRRRKAERDIAEIVDGATRFVDLGVRIRVVRMDLERGEALRDGPPLTVVREHLLGGIVDTAAAVPYFCEPSRQPATWFVSEDQETIVLHGPELPSGLLVYGSEGAGKTTALAQWHFLRVLAHLGEDREGGQTAPTEPRLQMILTEMRRLYRPSWYRFKASENLLTFVDGSRIRLVSTHKQSEAQGSRVQGFSWSWAGRDECQDQIEAHEDIESRGRAARAGEYKQLATATAKDNPRWRTFRDQLLASGHWTKHTLLGERSPFVWPSFWATKAKTMSAREYLRRVKAQDVGPERMTYPSWTRDNVRPRPVLGAKDITSLVLRRKTNDASHVLLVGHDPGSYKRASILLRAYQMPGEVDPVWWVVGELFTKGQSAEEHGTELLKLVRTDRFAVNLRRGGEQIHTRADPYGLAETKPDKDVYRIFSRLGISIKAAQYADNGKPGQIKRESRIEMINRLLCDASGKRRLFVDVDAQGRPVAPKLVESLEASERDEAGRPERERKDETDLSDCPAALAYGLWAFEKESAVHLRADVRKEIG